MTEHARAARNDAMIGQCYITMRAKFRAVLADLEGHGYRPRIQCAWRSVRDQRAAYDAGHSQVKWGFHCATNANGSAGALAIDVLDDDHPLEPPAAFLAALHSSAAAHGLDCPISWDPTHVEVTGMSITEAKRGYRPTGVTRHT
jgi:hypothetical protein